jgi:hypothetical protein
MSSCFASHIRHGRRDRIRAPNGNATIKPCGAAAKRVSISVNGAYAKVHVGGERAWGTNVDTGSDVIRP